MSDGTKRARTLDALLDCAALLSPSRGAGYQRLLNIAEMVDRGHYAPADALRIVGYGEHTQAGYDADERAAFALAREALARVAGVEDGAK